MGKEKLHKIPDRDPVGGGELYVSELANDDSGIVIRGRFEIPRYARLDSDQQLFLETFLRCRGMISRMEEELELSYPTIRSRLDALLDALELTPAKETSPKKEKSADKKRKILEQLEKGEITPEQAKEELGLVR